MKEFALYNPRFVLRSCKILLPGEPDVLTRNIMNRMSEPEISSLPPAVDELFYDALDRFWTTDKDYALMDKLRKGKANETTKESSEKKEVKTVELIYLLNNSDLYRVVVVCACYI